MKQILLTEKEMAFLVLLLYFQACTFRILTQDKKSCTLTIAVINVNHACI